MTQSYTLNGGGFSHFQAGISTTSADDVNAETWRAYEAAALTTSQKLRSKIEIDYLRDVSISRHKRRRDRLQALLQKEIRDIAIEGILGSMKEHLNDLKSLSNLELLGHDPEDLDFSQLILSKDDEE